MHPHLIRVLNSCQGGSDPSSREGEILAILNLPEERVEFLYDEVGISLCITITDPSKVMQIYNDVGSRLLQMSAQMHEYNVIWIKIKCDNKPGEFSWDVRQVSLFC